MIKVIAKRKTINIIRIFVMKDCKTEKGFYGELQIVVDVNAFNGEEE